jgi:Tfp pilus assembly PilM family ATPase
LSDETLDVLVKRYFSAHESVSRAQLKSALRRSYQVSLKRQAESVARLGLAFSSGASVSSPSSSSVAQDVSALRTELEELRKLLASLRPAQDVAQ